MTDPTPQTTPTRDEAVEAIVDQVEDVVLTDWFRHTGDPEASRRVVVRAVVSRMLACAPAPASGGVDALRSFLTEIVKAPETSDQYIHAKRLLASLSPAATPVSEAGGEVVNDVIEQITIHTVMHQREIGDLHGWCSRTRSALRKMLKSWEVHADDLRAERDSLRALNARALALAKPASSPALQPDAVSEPPAPCGSGCSGGEVREALARARDVMSTVADQIESHGLIGNAQTLRRQADDVRAALSQSTSAGRVGE